MSDYTATVAQAKADLQAHGVDLSGSDGAFNICVLAARRIPGGGVKGKPVGTNSHGCSIKSVVLKSPDEDGNNDFEVLISPGTLNTPEWKGFANAGAIWIDPRAAGMPSWIWETPAPVPVPPPDPVPPPAPGDLLAILSSIDRSIASIHSLMAEIATDGLKVRS